ncbi:MAG: hypothetical protein ACOVP4_01425 [Bacteriovoracaceae bacterium]
MNTKIKNILHDLNKFRDQMNCCYTCLSQDLRTGENPQDDDINDLKQASLEISRLVDNLSNELKGSMYEAR